MVLLMLVARHHEIMGNFRVGGPLYWLGWLATAIMAFGVVAMAVAWAL
jgi:dolichol kinase